MSTITAPPLASSSWPRLRAPKSKATVRMLASHTSGLAYWFCNPDIVRWEEATGTPVVVDWLTSCPPVVVPVTVTGTLGSRVSQSLNVPL